MKVKNYLNPIERSFTFCVLEAPVSPLTSGGTGQIMLRPRAPTSTEMTI